jgi:HAD superfamily hydrolase (TIGR01450 family)
MNEKLKKVKCFLLDMDGTVYLGGKVIDGAIEAVERMNAFSRAMFLTNNSSAARADYVVKLNKLGFTVTEDDVFTSGNATIEYLKANYDGKRIYLFGNDNLHEEFIRSGIAPVKDNPDLIVLGFHTSFDYDELTKLCDLIREGVPYIATHPDINCPTERGFKPDVGSFIALIEKSTGVSPILVCGKPNRPIGESIKRKLNLNGNEIAMVGDRLSTDMQFAINNGFVSVLVLSGEATLADLEKTGQKIDVILPSIASWDK